MTGSRVRRVVTGGAAALLCAALALPAASAAVRVKVLPAPTADYSAPFLPATMPLATATAWITSALSARATALTTLSGAISGSASLPVSDRSTLSSTVATDASAVSALEQKVPTETTIAALRGDVQAMVGAHILLLVTPVVNEVIAADGDLASAKALRRQSAALGAAITAAGQKRSTARLNADHRDLDNRLNAVTADVGNLPATLLALQPQDFPATQPSTWQGNGALARADRALSTANSDVANIVRLLAHPARTASVRTAA
ncbi:MAG TPA: hypothetical protein VNF07_02240 [Acidimicrobiales bacterium]|nr:hypothetical protein [Acidimicrobiales bacterium]